jgi:hypothetical protein
MATGIHKKKKHKNFIQSSRWASSFSPADGNQEQSRTAEDQEHSVQQMGIKMGIEHSVQQTGIKNGMATINRQQHSSSTKSSVTSTDIRPIISHPNSTKTCLP